MQAPYQIELIVLLDVISVKWFIVCYATMTKTANWPYMCPDPNIFGMKIDNRIPWFITVAMLAAGAVLPMFSFQQFYFFDSTYSLLSGIGYMFSEGEIFLAIIILLFSVIIPVIKMKLLYSLITGRVARHKQMDVLDKLVKYGKWSMLDVFVVAVLVSSVKLGSLANVEARVGIYIFSLGVLGSMWLTARALKLAE
jgi:paraquat-inducible protein A